MTQPTASPAPRGRFVMVVAGTEGADHAAALGAALARAGDDVHLLVEGAFTVADAPGVTIHTIDRDAADVRSRRRTRRAVYRLLRSLDPTVVNAYVTPGSAAVTRASRSRPGALVVRTFLDARAVADGARGVDLCVLARDAARDDAPRPRGLGAHLLDAGAAPGDAFAAELRATLDDLRGDGGLAIGVAAAHMPPHIGGLERYATTVMEVLRREHRMHPTVFTSTPPPPGRWLDGRAVPWVTLRPWVRVSNTPVNPLWALRMRREARRRGIRAMHAHAPVPFLADLAVRAAGVPAVLTYHAGSMVKGARVPDAVIGAYEARILPGTLDAAHAVVAASPTALTMGREVDVVSPGVDVDLFSPPAAEAGCRPPVVTYVGRLDATSRWKGVDVLMEAFAIVAADHPTARLRLVGTGDDRRRFVEDAARRGLGDRVEAPGSLAGEALADAYRTSRVVVLPSLSSAESFGMVLIEAMACGTPVIGSRVGGIPQAVGTDGEAGVLVEPGDARSLAEACRAVLDDDALATAMGRRARTRAAGSFAWAPRVAVYARLLREAAAAAR